MLYIKEGVSAITDLDIYYNNTQMPWGKLFYRILWEQLSFAKSSKILDFGSGFGITANYLALFNDVIAIEPNRQMCEMRFNENNYSQIIGGADALNMFADESFDCIICHNVLEYINVKDEYIKEFSRLLRVGGKLSLVKHNKFGRVMQKAIFENNIEQAIQILDGEKVEAQNFGEIKYYDFNDLERWAQSFNFKQVDNLGVRTFFALHPDNTIRYDENWNESIFKLEMQAGKIEELRNIAFYNHVILEKV